MKNIIIFGGTGFLGSWIVKNFIERYLNWVFMFFVILLLFGFIGLKLI